MLLPGVSSFSLDQCRWIHRCCRKQHFRHERCSRTGRISGLKDASQCHCSITNSGIAHQLFDSSSYVNLLHRTRLIIAAQNLVRNIQVLGQQVGIVKLVSPDRPGQDRDPAADCLDSRVPPTVRQESSGRRVAEYR